MSDSKSGSKTDLNESNMPLLDDVEKSGETPEKEQIEMKEEGDEEKDDSKDKEKDKKKKDKKKKEPKEKKPKGPSCIDNLSAGTGPRCQRRKGYQYWDQCECFLLSSFDQTQAFSVANWLEINRRRSWFLKLEL